MSFPLLASDHTLGQTIDFTFTQRDNAPPDNPNLSFNERFPYASPQELEFTQGAHRVLPFQPDSGQIVEVPEQRGLQLSQIQMFMDNQIHANGSRSDQVRERSEQNPADFLKSRQLAYHGSERLSTAHQ